MNVIIDRNVYSKIRSLNLKSLKKEQGGILLGHIFSDFILISDITLPSINDKSGKYFFIREKNNARKNLAAAWKKSNLKITYLGEWHTHFENIPTPSLTDKQTIEHMVETTETEVDFLYLLIVGFSSLWLGIQKKGAALEKIQLIDILSKPAKLITTISD